MRELRFSFMLSGAALLMRLLLRLRTRSSRISGVYLMRLLRASVRISRISRIRM